MMMERWILHLYFWLNFFLLSEINSRRWGPEAMSRCGKNSQSEILQEGVEVWEEKILLGNIE